MSFPYEVKSWSTQAINNDYCLVSLVNVFVWPAKIIQRLPYTVSAHKVYVCYSNQTYIDCVLEKPLMN